MYFNVFLYNTITTDPGYIAAMVGWSARRPPPSRRLLMGALSDRVGRRKAFICAGLHALGTLDRRHLRLHYTVENRAGRFSPRLNAVSAAAAVMVVVLDCVMTFFGSTANDAAFNAYVTDITDSDNRGRVESVLAILPLISMLVIFGGLRRAHPAGEMAASSSASSALLGESVVGLVSLVFLIKDRPRS